MWCPLLNSELFHIFSVTTQKKKNSKCTVELWSLVKQIVLIFITLQINLSHSINHVYLRSRMKWRPMQNLSVVLQRRKWLLSAIFMSKPFFGTEVVLLQLGQNKRCARTGRKTNGNTLNLELLPSLWGNLLLLAFAMIFNGSYPLHKQYFKFVIISTRNFPC